VWDGGESYRADRTAALPLTPDGSESASVPETNDPKPDDHKSDAPKADAPKPDAGRADGGLARAYDRIKSAEEAAQVFEAGADKISVNSAALKDPSLISEIGKSFGAQAVVVAIDARRDPEAKDPVRDAQVFVQGGRKPAGRRVVEWAREAEERGAGEILLTSMDSDGTRAGFDCELTAAVSGAVNIPVIASGGAGTVAHFADVFGRGKADAALAASIFHFGVSSARLLKEELVAAGVPVRLPC